MSIADTSVLAVVVKDVVLWPYISSKVGDKIAGQMGRLDREVSAFRVRRARLAGLVFEAPNHPAEPKAPTKAPVHNTSSPCTDQLVHRPGFSCGTASNMFKLEVPRLVPTDSEDPYIHTQQVKWLHISQCVRAPPTAYP